MEKQIMIELLKLKEFNKPQINFDKIIKMKIISNSILRNINLSINV